MKNNYKAAQYLITAFHLQFSVRMEEQERFDKMNWNGSRCMHTRITKMMFDVLIVNKKISLVGIA